MPRVALGQPHERLRQLPRPFADRDDVRGEGHTSRLVPDGRGRRRPDGGAIDCEPELAEQHRHAENGRFTSGQPGLEPAFPPHLDQVGWQRGRQDVEEHSRVQ
jgi:hypothetical protein